MVASDASGVVTCFNKNGETDWEARMQGFTEHAAVFGDLNNDGEIEVVIATNQGALHVL